MAHSPDQQQLAAVNHRAILRDAAAREETFHAQQFARRIAIFQPPSAASAHGCRARMCAWREGGGRRMRRRPVAVFQEFLMISI
ncbi:hypothetical protein F511_43663 [Dorcoceras hygrometricum]|uniref:Uncharacterized protein n=1 Tax=Dorcoceras hygrometricum TaxID=472368 RepID=A0A2Z7AG60_9LAMI|nr:hypothetical protein F511_43663 [Dorcoceras hygrometricum]